MEKEPQNVKRKLHETCKLDPALSKERSSRIRQDVISLEKRVAITLHYLKDQSSMQMTSNPFGIARCTVGQVMKEITAILTIDFGPQFTRFTVDKDEVLESTTQFSQFHLVFTGDRMY